MRGVSPAPPAGGRRGEGASQSEVLKKSRGTAMRTPDGLESGGSALWRAVTAAHDLDPCQRVILLEACRIKDRLDRLAVLVDDRAAPWARVGNYELTVAAPDARTNQTADLLKQLLGALRLPDRYGRRPQRRGTSRGVYSTRNPNTKEHR